MMVENNFKAGDKVRVIEVDFMDEDVVEVGEEFVVQTAYVADEHPKTYIDIITSRGDSWCLYESQVELIESAEDLGKIRVTDIVGFDAHYGIEIGDVYDVVEIHKHSVIVIAPSGKRREMLDRQFEFVTDEEYNKDLELGEMQAGEEREKNYIEETIEKLEEELMLAEGRLEEHHEAVAKAEMLIRDKDWLQSDLEEEVEALSDAIQALRKV